jgi:glycine/D-amino acid oxidase-like deaminating enzyme
LVEVAVIGGGIAGCSVAALLAEAGATVTLFEREEIAAGASGRNSGVIQHPLDPVLVPLHEASLELYRELGHGFTLPADPSGLLVVGGDPQVLAAETEAAAAAFPELAPELLEGAALQAAEPALAAGTCAYRLHTGRPIPPAAATNAWAERARAAGARLVVGESVTVAQAQRAADSVVVAAGPWTAAVLGATRWRAVTPLWGVVAQVRLENPPRHTIEEVGVKALTSPGGGPPSLFSIVTAGGASGVGSTFSPEEPDAPALARLLLERGARYVPALEDAKIEGVRACARPLSGDGRPLLGEIDEGVYLLTGHGPWGISLGPGSAQLVAEMVLGRRAEVAPELAAARFGAP